MGEEEMDNDRPRRTAKSLPRAFLLSLAAACALVLYLVWNSYANTRRAAETTAENVATAVAGEIAWSRQHLQEGLRVFAESAAVIDALGGDGPGDRDRVHWMLETYLRQHHDLAQLTLYDTAGNVRVVGRPSQPAPVALGSTWFRPLLDGRGAQGIVEIIDPQESSPPSLLLADRIVDAAGRIIGVIVAQRSLAEMTESFAALDIGPDGALAIRRIDSNRAMLRRPAITDGEGPPPLTPVSSRVKAGERSGRAHYRGPDGIWRTYAFRVVDGLPLYVNSGLADDHYLAAWRRHTIWMMLATAIVLGALWLSMSRRMVSEAKLAESEQLFRSLSEATPAMVWMSRLDGRAIFVNPAWLQFTGRSLEDELTVDWVEDVHPDDRAASIEAYSRALSSDRVSVIEYRKRRHDGAWRWVIDTAQLRRGADDAPLGYVGTQIDITERKQAETEMAEKLKLQHQLTTIAATVPGLIYTFRREANGDGHFTYVSPRIESLLGTPAEDLKRDSARIMDLIHPDDRARVRAGMREAAQRRDRWQDQYRVQHPKNGTIWVDARAVATTEADGSVSWYGFIHDITARQKAELALRDSEARFRSYIESAPISILIIGSDGLIRECNSMVGEILGFPHDSLKAKPFSQLIDAQDSAVVNGAFAQLIANGYAMAEFRVRRSSGDSLWASARGSRLPDGDFLVYVLDITDRRTAEAALLRSEETMRLAMAAAPMGTWDWNFRSGEILWSPTKWAILGRTPQSVPVSLELFRSIVHPDDLDRVMSALDQARRQGSRYEVESRAIRPDGSIRWIISHGQVLRDAAGEAQRMVGVAVDITERKQSEQALIDSERRNRVALDIAELGAFSHDLRSGLVTLDERARSHFGFDQAVLTAEAFLSRILDEDRHAVLQKIALAHDPRRSDGQYSIENRVMHPDGRIRWLAMRAHVQFEGVGEARRAVYVIGNSLDVTERKVAEQALLESQKRYQALVDRSPDAIYVCRNGLVQFLNPAAVSLFGARSASELIGRDALEFFAEQERPLIRERREQVARGESVPVIEHEIVRLDGGRRTVEVVVAPNVDGDASRHELQVILRDITERRVAELQLAQAQRMEAIGQLTGGLAHDFNNILGIILGSLDLLSLENLDEEARGLIAAAQSAANRGAEVTRSLLAVARQRPMTSRVVDVNVLISDMRPLIQQTSGRRIETVLDLGAPRSLVSMDAGSFDSALLNMILNARDAMPDGGCLTVRTRNRRIDAINGVARLPDGDYLEIVVVDTGTGMAPEIIARAFDPFFSTKERGKGTGLGLAMVYGFARQCGGTAFIESSPGTGTRLHMMLPVATASTPEPIRNDTDRLPHARAGESVLLVDDEADLRAICSQWAESLGYRVTAVASPSEALHWLGSQHFDALITDVVMPGTMDGASLAAAVRTRHPEIAVLLISGYADGSIDQSARPWRLLEKPFRRDQLAHELRAALDEMATARH